MLKSLVRSFFQTPGAPASGEPLVVGVSGGPDSVALLHVLVALQDILGLKLHVAHMNHSLRGEASQGDENFVESLSKTLGLPFHTHRISPEDPPATPSEAAMRNQRYAFLADVRQRVGASWIATGHTASDQGETLLMNLLRGAGPRGLGGMLPLGPRDVLRPLLRASRTQVMEYLSRHDLPYREDATNQDTRLTRNRVRHELIPLLETLFSPQVGRTLSREAELFAALDDYMRQESSRALEACLVEATATTRILEVETLMAHHPALTRYILRLCLEDLTQGTPGVHQLHVDTLLELARDPQGTKDTALPGGIRVSREYNRLILTTESSPGVPCLGPVVLDMRGKGHLLWGSHRLRWDILPWEQGQHQETHNHILLDLAETHGSLWIRSLRTGDRIEPKGMEGSQKVSSLLIDRKVPRRGRHDIPILCDNGGPSGSDRILWVIGQRRSRHACIKPETSQVVVFKAETKHS